MNLPPENAARLADLGPRYAETDLARFPVEPWATWTNLVFLAVIVYWAWRLRGQFRRHRLLAVALPLLGIGWLGGTLYHATRSSPAWFLMDWLPIVALLLMAATWLWRRLLPNLGLAVTAAVLPLLVAGALGSKLAHGGAVGISASYALIAGGNLVPAVIHAVRGTRRARGWLALVVACFAAALAFRLFDAPLAQAGWPHGSHYLWHIFGGAATFGMFGFLYELRSADGG